MSKGVDFTSNYTGGEKILRPGAKVRQAPVKTQPQEVKSKTFSINKSYQTNNTSQTYKKHILPVLNQIKQMEIDKKKEDQRIQKQTIQKQKMKEEEVNKDQIRDDIRIDQHGRTIDKDGNLVLIQKQLFSTLINQKLNKKQHKKELEKKTKKKAYQKASKFGFQDNNIASSTKRRLRRTLAGLQFEDDEDVYQKQEDKDQLGGNLQDLLAPKIQKAPRKLKKTKRTKLQTQQLIPEKQWWDAQFIINSSYFQTIKDEEDPEKLKQSHNKNIQNANQTIKNLIDFSKITGQTPQFQLFADIQQKPIVMPIFLTKDQKKKLKRMRKRQKLKQKNDQIKLGMSEPDKPKLKISNMAQVMKQEYILDPSRVQLEVKKQIQGRLDTHNQTNEARKLTKQKKVEKVMRKLKRDSAKETRVAVFRIDDVRDRTHRFKIQMNAKQLAINGLFLFPSERYKGPAVVIAQGGRRAIKFYKNLLMNRIQWSSIDKANLVAKDQQNQEQVEHQKMTIRNRCHLIWEAVINDTLFTKWRAVQISNQPEAIRALAERKAQHFWDMIINFKQEA